MMALLPINKQQKAFRNQQAGKGISAGISHEKLETFEWRFLGHQKGLRLRQPLLLTFGL